MPDVLQTAFIKIKNAGGTFDTILPITKSQNVIVDGADTRLDAKLTAIEAAIAEKTAAADLGAANGIATLDANGTVPLSQLPPQVKEVRVVATIAARDAISDKFSGLSVFVQDATGDVTVTAGGAYYIYDGSSFIKTAESESMDVVLQWANVQNKPTTLAGYGITDGVNISEVVTTAAPNKILKLNAEGKLVANVVGNADTASKLATARTISLSGAVAGSVAFDGSGNVDISTALQSGGTAVSATEPALPVNGLWFMTA